MSESVKVMWSLGHTTNLGNFESMRVDCSITDYARENETATEASERVYRFVERELVKKVKEARKELEEG
jgi:hypothetical protein